MKQLRVVIRGRVQGVWFRGWTAEQAGRLGLSGWVRNRKDGSVEAVFRGDDEAVDSMLKHCWQGPRFARVTSVESEVDRSPIEPGFHHLPSH